MIKIAELAVAIAVSLAPVVVLAQPTPPAHQNPRHHGDAGVMPPGHHPGMTPPAGGRDGGMPPMRRGGRRGMAPPAGGGRGGMPPMGGGAMRHP